MTKNLRTTVAATLIAICQAVALCLPKYSAYFQGASIILTPIWGYLQADAKKEM